MRPIYPGLCSTCGNARTVENRRGSTFFLCTLSAEDARFPRYPALPVLSCAGWRADEGVSATGAE